MLLDSFLASVENPVRTWASSSWISSSLAEASRTSFQVTTFVCLVGGSSVANMLHAARIMPDSILGVHWVSSVIMPARMMALRSVVVVSCSRSVSGGSPGRTSLSGAPVGYLEVASGPRFFFPGT